MFTGIVQAMGNIGGVEARDRDARLQVNSGALDLTDVQLGDSIAVNGVCLTVVQLHANGFAADVSRETLQLSTLGTLKASSRVNLEKALTLSTRLGGHLVSGHVDGIGTVIERHGDGRSERFTLEAPTSLARYIAHKGSITVDGTSLTVNAVDGNRFQLNIVPHTLEQTLIAGYAPGTRVNLEVDLIARYLERLMLGDAAAQRQSGVSESLLARAGFIQPD